MFKKEKKKKEQKRERGIIPKVYYHVEEIKKGQSLRDQIEWGLISMSAAKSAKPPKMQTSSAACRAHRASQAAESRGPADRRSGLPPICLQFAGSCLKLAEWKTYQSGGGGESLPTGRKKKNERESEREWEKEMEKEKEEDGEEEGEDGSKGLRALGHGPHHSPRRAPGAHTPAPKSLSPSLPSTPPSPPPPLSTF